MWTAAKAILGTADHVTVASSRLQTRYRGEILHAGPDTNDSIRNTGATTRKRVYVTNLIFRYLVNSQYFLVHRDPTRGSKLY